MSKETENLLKKVADGTDNFTRVDLSILVRYPKAIKLFRLMLEKDQRSFAKLIGRNQQWVSAIERGFIHNISETEAERLAILLGKINLRKFASSEILRNEKQIANRGKFCGEYARKWLSSPQEKAP